MSGKGTEIREIQAYEFAGTVYRERDDAERALARLNLREFIGAGLAFDGMQSANDRDDAREEVLIHLERNYEKYIGLLNKFY